MQSAALKSPSLSKERLLGLVVLLATLVAFRNSLDGTYLLDDFDAIHNNVTIQHLWPPWAALQPPRETSVAGRPLVNLSLAVNYAIHGVLPRGYHLVNLGIHAAAALTLYGLLLILLRSPALAGKFDGDAALIATIVAGLWAVHPLQTESVTYVVQRAESLCGLMYLLTLYSFARSMTSHHPTAWGVASIIACFVGMGCKEVMVTAPVMVLLIDRALYAGSFRTALSSRRGLYIGLAASWLVLAALLMESPRPNSAGAAVASGPMAYLRTEAGVLLHYLRLSIWPDPLILDYNWPISSWSQALPSLVAIAALLAIMLFVWFRRPVLALPAVAFFLLLAPTSSVYPILDACFEHRMYLPLAPVILLVVLGLRELVNCLASRSPATRDGVLIAIALALAAALTMRTVVRNAEYADPVAIWQSNLVHGGLQNARALTNLSGAFMATGQYFEAREAALHAIRLADDNPEAYANLCAAANQLGYVDESINMGRIAVALRKTSVECHVNLGLAYKSARRLDEARAEFETALTLQPGCVPARVALDGLSLLDAAGVTSQPGGSAPGAPPP